MKWRMINIFVIWFVYLITNKLPNKLPNKWFFYIEILVDCNTIIQSAREYQQS